ncbi:glycoside hydrolase family 26 protein [Flavobacterium sp. 5]|uniref:glycoside hydrolase family 26 protein n=1 Tax=Flavobacterium sp. 5 TaxID=2035199 RepID=UPI000C2B68EA|nr:glycosyl hydrolase [Flavobacterium sp. 5]PKB17813.1 mannan endo-1,4-beta-mannosidase [Flavobacterium sp. 5]
MTKYYTVSVLLGIFTLFSCSGSDSTTDTSKVDPPVVVNTAPLTTQNVTTHMADPNATAETIALFYNLKTLAKTKFAIGQQDAFNGFYNNDATNESDIKKTTTYNPALLGSDFIFITDKNNNEQSDNWFYQQEQKTINDIKSAYAKGMINTMSWHLREPNNEDSFYADDMTTEQKTTTFKSILTGGVNHEWYKKKLDKVARVFLNLKGINGELIPVIFRPFHEFDGSWFWWGSNFCTAEEYKKAYQFTVTYLRDAKGVHNLLYAFSPDNSYSKSADYLKRYPGDTYVDVLGMDNYGDLNNQGQTGADKANAKLKMLSDLATTKVKIAAMTETGYRVSASVPPVNNWFSTYLYSTLTASNIQISYVMFWNNNQDGYYVPTPAASNADDFKTFAKKPKSALVNTLPKMYELPK